jgi:hypothetical protein
MNTRTTYSPGMHAATMARQLGLPEHRPAAPTPSSVGIARRDVGQIVQAGVLRRGL